MISGIVILLIVMISSSGFVGAKIDSRTDTLEGLIARRIMKHIVYDGSKVYFSSNGKGSPWRDTLYACEALTRLNTINKYVGEDLREGLKNFVLDRRIDEPIYASASTTTIKGDNNTSIYEDGSRTIIGKRKVNWWGSIQKSVEALRILQLINRSSDEIIESVRNKTLIRMRSNGVHLLVGEEGWEEMYWALYKARVWGYFDLMAELGLPLISKEQIQKSQKPISIDDTVLYTVEARTTKVEKQSCVLTPKLKRINTSATGLDLFLPTLFELGINNDIYRTLPKFKLIFTINTTDEYIKGLNCEEREYAIANNILYNVTKIQTYTLTGPDGKIVLDTNGEPMTYEEEVIVEELGYRGLEFYLDVNIHVDQNYTLEYTYEILDSTNETIEITINNVDNYQYYYALFNTYQITHEPQVKWKYELTENESKQLELLNESYQIQQSKIGANDSLTFRDYVREYPTIYQYLYENEQTTTWLEKKVPIKLDYQLQFEAPAINALTVNPPKEGTYYLNTSDKNDYDLWIYSPVSNASWGELEENNYFYHSVIIDGYGSLGISNCTKEIYNVLLFPIENDTLKEGTNLVLEVRSVKRDYGVINPLDKYVDLFNNTLIDLEELIQGMEFFRSLCLEKEFRTFVNPNRLAQLALYHYNTTNRLFDEDYELTYKTWTILDYLNLTSQLFSKNDYNWVLMSYFNTSYEEQYDPKTNTITGVRILKDKNRLAAELHDTKVFIDILTYKHEWPEEQLDRISSQYNDIGLGIYDRHAGTGDEYEAYQKAYAKIQQEMYANYGTDLEEILEEDTPSIRLRDSYYLSNANMYWLTQPEPLSIADYFLNIFIIAFGLVCTITSTIEGGENKNKLTALIVFVLITVQSLATPIITNDFAKKFHKYISSVVAFVGMLEEQIYKVCEELGSIAGTVVEKPKVIVSKDNTVQDTTTGELTLEQNITRTLKVAYHEYVEEYQVIKSRWAELYARNGGSYVTGYYGPLLSYEGFVQQYGVLALEQYSASQTAKYQKEAKIKAERAKQRLSLYGAATEMTGAGVSLAPLMNGMTQVAKLFTGAISMIGSNMGALGKMGVLMRNIPVAINNDLSLPVSLQTKPLVDDVLNLISQTPQFSQYLNDQKIFAGGEFFISSKFYPVLEYLYKFNPVTEKDMYLKMDLMRLVISHFTGKQNKIQEKSDSYPGKMNRVGGTAGGSGGKDPKKKIILEVETPNEDIITLTADGDIPLLKETDSAIKFLEQPDIRKMISTRLVHWATNGIDEVKDIWVYVMSQGGVKGKIILSREEILDIIWNVRQGQETLGVVELMGQVVKKRLGDVDTLENLINKAKTLTIGKIDAELSKAIAFKMEKYRDMGLLTDDIYDAINELIKAHKIAVEMTIEGGTAKEAAITLRGTLASNAMEAMGIIRESFAEAKQNVFDHVNTLYNLLTGNKVLKICHDNIIGGVDEVKIGDNLRKFLMVRQTVGGMDNVPRLVELLGLFTEKLGRIEVVKKYGEEAWEAMKIIAREKGWIDENGRLTTIYLLKDGYDPEIVKRIMLNAVREYAEGIKKRISDIFRGDNKKLGKIVGLVKGEEIYESAYSKTADAITEILSKRKLNKIGLEVNVMAKESTLESAYESLSEVAGWGDLVKHLFKEPIEGAKTIYKSTLGKLIGESYLRHKIKAISIRELLNETTGDAHNFVAKVLESRDLKKKLGALGEGLPKELLDRIEGAILKVLNPTNKYPGNPDLLGEVEKSADEVEDIFTVQVWCSNRLPMKI